MGRTRKKICNMHSISLKKTKKIIPLKPTFNIANFHYTVPVKDDLAIGIVFFNSTKSKRLLMNYLYNIEKLKLANIPVYTLEMYIDTPEIKDAFHYKTEFILFQKERLCYLLEKHIPKKYTKILFMDSDILFENNNWYNELSKKLDSFNIVQPFSNTLWLDVTYTKIVKKRIPFVFYKTFGKLNLKGGIGGYHPGFAWGFQRDWYKKIGFFVYAILGDGDTISSSTILNYPFSPEPYLQDSLQEYKNKIKTPPSTCFLHGTVYHLWHGDSKKRQYTKRRQIFSSIKDIRDVITIDSNGLFALKDDPELKRKIKRYFQNRDDDGI
jgi:hypothetical protein